MYLHVHVGAEVKKATNSTTTKGKNKSARDDGSATPRDSPSRTVRVCQTCSNNDCNYYIITVLSFI